MSNEELTLVKYHAMCTAAGVTAISITVKPEGIGITLIGLIDGKRTVVADQLLPHGGPFDLVAMLVLQEFRQGVEGGVPAPRPTPAEPGCPGLVEHPLFPTVGPRAVAPLPTPAPEAPTIDTPTALKPDGKILTEAQAEELVQRWKQEFPAVAQALGTRLEGPVEDIVAVIKSTGFDPNAPIPETNPTDVIARAASSARERAALIAGCSRESGGEPPKHGEGHRRPLSLPLCTQCGAQPVSSGASKFCGAACERRSFLVAATARQGVKLP